MKRRSAPVDIAALRKVLILNPKKKNVCTLCGVKMRLPKKHEEPTPTCDNCAQDILLDIVPKLLDELDAVRKTLAARPKVVKVEKIEKAKKTKAKVVEKPKLRIVKSEHAPAPAESEPKLKDEAPKEPESDPTDVSALALQLEAEQKSEAKAKRQQQQPAAEETSTLAPVIEDEQSDESGPRRRIVRFVPATPKEVQNGIMKLREKFER
jgi:hypothetical protein